MSTQKLRLGILLDSIEVPAWLFHSLGQIAASSHAEFAVIFLNENAPKDSNGPWLSKLWQNRKAAAYLILNHIDEKLFLRGRPDASAKMNLQKILGGVPLVSLRPNHDGNVDGFNSEDVNRIKNFHLDILIKAGYERLSGDIGALAKYGVWYYEHSDNRVKRGGPPGFWEVVDNWPETSASLTVIDECSHGGRAVYRSSFLTYPFSPARNRNTSLWAASSFLPRQIDLLHRLGDARFFLETTKYNTGFDFFDRKKYQPPTNLASFKHYGRLVLRNLVELYQRISRQDSWYLMFEKSNSVSLSFADFQKITPPKDRFWADPHVIRKDDNYYIFVEEYIHKNRKGHISVIEMDLQGRYKDPVPVLEKNYHFSYPFVFEHDHKYYMVPESAQNRTIDLYECVDFPFQWKYKMTLMDHLQAVDTTVFFYLGKWWLFTGLAENEGSFPEVELFLFYSEELFSTEWKGHPLNPVISDVTRARPAGKLFIQEGKLYRPSQDCSRNYGYGFNINEILRLSETEYLEKTVAAVKPNWDSRLIATHTFTSVNGLSIIDGLTRRSKLF